MKKNKKTLEEKSLKGYSKMKFKTLKDMEDISTDAEDESHEYVSKRELKQEAIKWVKHCRVREPALWLDETDFMDFHNITEEDLK